MDVVDVVFSLLAPSLAVSEEGEVRASVLARPPRGLALFLALLIQLFVHLSLPVSLPTVNRASDDAHEDLSTVLIYGAVIIVQSLLDAIVTIESHALVAYDTVHVRVHSHVNGRVAPWIVRDTGNEAGD